MYGRLCSVAGPELGRARGKEATVATYMHTLLGLDLDHPARRTVGVCRFRFARRRGRITVNLYVRQRCRSHWNNWNAAAKQTDRAWY